MQLSVFWQMSAMQLKVRFAAGSRREVNAARIGPLLSMASGLLTLLSVSCLTLAAWRLTSDLGWTGEFAIATGFLSHWLVWLALTIGFAIAAARLARWNRSRLNPGFEEDAEVEAPSALITR